jgi:hypothetical protein
VLIEKGLEPGTLIFLNNPENPEKFRLEGKDLMKIIKEREKSRSAMAGTFRKKPGGVF